MLMHIIFSYILGCNDALTKLAVDDPWPYAKETVEELIELQKILKTPEVEKELRFRLEHDLLTIRERKQVEQILGEEDEK